MWFSDADFELFNSIIWFNWFLVGLFDVRFVTDSIFERVARTAHLGVIVGFAVVAPNYDPDNQSKGVFQALCKHLLLDDLSVFFLFSLVV